MAVSGLQVFKVPFFYFLFYFFFKSQSGLRNASFVHVSLRLHKKIESLDETISVITMMVFNRNGNISRDLYTGNRNNEPKFTGATNHLNIINAKYVAVGI